MADKQTKTIQWTINLPMDFPSDWDEDMIEFHLNESSWCCSNLINELKKYDEENGCICGICEAKVADKIENLLNEEKNKTLDEVLKACDIEYGLYSGDVKNLIRHILMRVLDGLKE